MGLGDMIKDITNLVQRLDYDKSSVNCSTCSHKIGKVCDHYHAVLQSNPHRPTDCSHWEEREVNGHL